MSDFSQMDVLRADLRAAQRNVIPAASKALEVTARHVQDDWRTPLEGSEYVPGGAPSVTYEITVGASLLATAVSAEVGPVVGQSGSLVGMLEMGTPTSGPRGFGLEALRKNEADFVRGIQKAGEDAF